MFYKTTALLAALECTLVIKPVLKSCQLCCETDSFKVCKFVKDCSKGIEPEEQQPKETEKPDSEKEKG